MIKIIIKLLIILTLFWLFWAYQNSYAWEATITVEVTEKIPWINCTPNENWKTYNCESERWFWAITLAMWWILKYFTFLAWMFAVLSLVVGWIMYSMWWANESMKTSAKDYIQKSLLWLIVLLLSWTILYMIAPWVYV
jgi:hypothetical protein